jgi:DNA-binding helix-hairpin-helix protein with protein kinase domain
MSTRPPKVVDSTGNRVRLGKALGQGGEGAVYEVATNPKLVAKIYHKPLPAERADKIRVMGALRTGTLDALTAWPIDVVREFASGAPVGLLVPKVTNGRDIHQLYSPKSRRAEFQRADWRFLVRAAANTARGFAAVHEAGYVIGDVNHGGVLVHRTPPSP